MLTFADIKTTVNKNKRVVGGDRAFLFTEGTASFDATKARGIDLPEELEFDFHVFKKYLKDDYTPKKEYNRKIDDIVADPVKASPQFIATMEQLKEKVGEEKYNDFLLSHQVSSLENVIDKTFQTKLYKGLKALVA